MSQMLCNREILVSRIELPAISTPNELDFKFNVCITYLIFSPFLFLYKNYGMSEEEIMRSILFFYFFI